MKTLGRPFRVNEAVVRGVALQIFLLSLTAIFTMSIIPVIIMLLDFSIRVILLPSYSPLVFVSKKVIVPVLGFRKRLIVFKPKRFAAGIGMFMSLTALLLIINNLFVVGIVVLAVLSLFSSLEAFFKFCAGCKIFGLLMKMRIFKEDECVDCVFQDGSGI